MMICQMLSCRTLAGIPRYTHDAARVEPMHVSESPQTCMPRQRSRLGLDMSWTCSDSQA